MLPQSVPASPNLSRRLAKLTSILDVAKAMSAERDLDLLLPLILYEATKVVESDRCSPCWSRCWYWGSGLAWPRCSAASWCSPASRPHERSSRGRMP